MQQNELKAFIKENSYLIQEYINCVILKDIGTMSHNFFMRLVDNYFNKENKRISCDNLTPDTLVYFLLAEVLGEAKQAFPFFRKDTLTLDNIFKDAKVYFNHVKFTIEGDTFNIYLIQTKAGVSTLEEEIVKYTKQFPMKTSGLEEFIAKKSK
ncbi:MAG: hypothetical protein HWD90_08970 [Campylobacteraceae bacterium]|nr:hypothetical protein [Campylobacteraceae bacterium]